MNDALQGITIFTIRLSTLYVGTGQIRSFRAAPSSLWDQPQRVLKILRSNIQLDREVVQHFPCGRTRQISYTRQSNPGDYSGM